MVDNLPNATAPQNPVADNNIVVEDINTFTPVDIFIDGDMQERVYLDLTYDAIIQTNTYGHPTIYQNGGQLVRILKNVHGVRTIQRLDYDRLYNAIMYRVNYLKHIPLKRQVEYSVAHNFEVSPVALPATIPPTIVRTLLARTSYDSIPNLIGIATCPIINLETGCVRFDTHYDPLSGMYYGATDLCIPPIPDNPTESEVNIAVSLLKECIIDFPFVTSTDETGFINTISQTNALALLITTVLRPSIPGCVPIFLIDKPAAGTGASLLCDTFSLISTGESTNVITIAKEEEWKKVVVSVLMSGKLLTVIDNIEGKVDLPTLSSVVTASAYCDRILGENKLFEGNPRTVWLLNGNNVIIGGDLPRRVVWIRMDARLERPWTRAEQSFRHPNQKEWIIENRGRILSAVYTIVRAWIRDGKGMPGCDVPYMGGFAEWRNIIGGILHHAGITGFMGNASEMMEEVDVDAPQSKNFFTQFYEKLQRWDHKTGSRNDRYEFKLVERGPRVCFFIRTITEMIENEKDSGNLCIGEQRLVDCLPDPISNAHDNGRDFSRVVGNYMRRHRDQTFGNIKLLKGKTSHQAVEWLLEKVE